MAFLTLPRRKRTTHLVDRLPSTPRRVKEMRDHLPDVPSFSSMPALSALSSLPELSEIVEAALEAGAKHRPAMPVIRQRRRGHRTTKVVLFAVLIGGLVLAYRWWNGRRGDAAELLDEPYASGDAPGAMPPPSGWTTPSASALEPPPGVSSPSQPKTEDQVVSGSESATSADPTGEQTATAAHDGSTVTPLSSTPEASMRLAREETPRPRPPMGRGISPSMPSLPARRTSMPGRPSSFHPR